MFLLNVESKPEVGSVSNFILVLEAETDVVALLNKKISRINRLWCKRISWL